MGLNRLDHYSVRTTQLERTRDFYVDVLGLVDGERPDLGFPGNWLYLGDQAVIHLLGVDEASPDALTDHLGDRDDAELTGGGAVDHIAFRASDLGAMHANLEKLGVAWRDREIPDINLHQIFLEDPNGITIELNFDGE